MHIRNKRTHDSFHSYTHCQFYAELCIMYIRLFIHFVFFFSDAAAAIKLSFGEFHEIFAILLLQRRLHDIVSIVLTVCAKALSTAAARKSRIRKKVASYYFHLVLCQFILHLLCYKIFLTLKQDDNCRSA